jgi:hypothetical protein
MGLTTLGCLRDQADSQHIYRRDTDDLLGLFEVFSAGLLFDTKALLENEFTTLSLAENSGAGERTRTFTPRGART